MNALIVYSLIELKSDVMVVLAEIVNTVSVAQFYVVLNIFSFTNTRFDRTLSSLHLHTTEWVGWV
jgi:hypothetical protein